MDSKDRRFNTLYTIGYADLRMDRFIHLLKGRAIEAVADVRSSPFSRYYHEFNRENLSSSLKHNGIKYVYLGRELGARRTEEECYVNERVSYDLVYKTEAFQEGVRRLLSGLGKMSVVLLCAEKDPIDCHRAILICRYVRDYPVSIQHILHSERIESHRELEMRLLRLLGLDNMELFRTQHDILQDAYGRQAGRIAFSRDRIKSKERTYASG